MGNRIYIYIYIYIYISPSVKARLWLKKFRLATAEYVGNYLWHHILLIIYRQNRNDSNLLNPSYSSRRLRALTAITPQGIEIRHLIWAATWESVPFDMRSQRRLKSACAFAQSDQCLIVRMKKLCTLCYLKCAQWRFLSDYANVQADLSLRSAHKSKGTLFWRSGSMYLSRRSCTLLHVPFHVYFKLYNSRCKLVIKNNLEWNVI